MKKIDKLVLTNFAGPYILSFFIAEFVLIMQFLWRYIDDILGKGFSMFEIMELIVYYGITIIPMALPISILIASVMVFGDISEKYELTSMKSAGISLLRVMRPGIMLACATALFSIFASNFLKPTATLQFKKRFSNIRKQKSSLSIEQGIFNDDFRNYNIRVENKEKDGNGVGDILIYDHTNQDKSLINLIRAKSGEMFTTPDGKYFVMNLEDGNFYQEDAPERKSNGRSSYPLMRTSFEKWKKVFDMSEFSNDQNAFDISRNKQDMLNSYQLYEHLKKIKIDEIEMISQLHYKYGGVREAEETSEILDQKILFDTKRKIRLDSIKLRKDSIKASKELEIVNETDIAKEKFGDLRKIISRPINKTQIRSSNNAKQLNLSGIDTLDHFYETFDSLSLKSIVIRARSAIVTRANTALSIDNNMIDFGRERSAYLLRLNQQFSFAFICIIFLFIGAPLGSIIRKGGYGYPMLVAILFYMIFIISTIMGEKLVKSATFNGIEGAWVACVILLPFAVLFTYKALNDAKFNGIEKLEIWISNYLEAKKEKKNKL